MRQGIKFLLGLILIFVTTLLPFGRSVQYGLVNFDDLDYVAHAYKEPLRVADVDMAIWMPVTWASYKLDYLLAGCGEDATTEDFARADRVMHGHSVLIHAVNAALLFLLLALLFKGQAGVCACALGALAWALHPLRCESVCWIASRKDVLSMLGVLLALICWVRFRMATGRRLWWYAGALLCFVLGAACKPSAMLFAPLAFVLDWLVLGRVRVVEDMRKVKRWIDARLKAIARCDDEGVAATHARASCDDEGVAATPNDGDALEIVGKYLPYVVPGAMCVGLAFFASWAQAAGGAMDQFGNLSLGTRLANAAAAFGIYLKNTVWPFGLAVFSRYRCPELPRFFVPGVCLTLLACAVLAFFCMRVARDGESRFGRGRFLFAALLWFCIGIFPFIGIKAFGVEPFADRFTYIPSVGWSLVIVVALAHAKRWAWVLACVVLAGLGVRAFDQTGVWENDRTLWAQTVAVDGDKNAVAWANLGLWYFEFPHDLAKAEECFRNSVKYDDDGSGKIYDYYIYTLCEQGKIEEAGKVYERFALWDARKVREFATDPSARDTTGFIGSRLVYLSCKPETREQAFKEMKEILPIYRRRHERNILYASFLMGLTEKEEFDAIPPVDYVRFRFVKEHGKPLRFK